MVRRTLLRISRRRAITAIIAVIAVAAVAALAAQAVGTRGAGASGQNGCYLNGSVATASCSYKGLSAVAQISSTDSTGCVVSSTDVFAATHVQRGSQTGSTDVTTAYVTVDVYDQCAGNLLAEGFGFADSPTFQIDSALAQAHIDMTAPVTDDISGAMSTYTVSLTFRGIGATTKTTDSFHLRSPHYAMHSHYAGDTRAAFASGTVSDGTTTFSGTTAYATLMSVSGGELLLAHGGSPGTPG